MTIKVLVFAGSARRDSLNKKLARLAAEAARKAGAEVTYIDLNDYPMPVYHGDDEAASGIPDNGKKLKALFKSHQALIIASPENNSSVSSLLKNTIDWLSRPDGSESGMVPFKDKTALLMGASPGPFGGVRGLNHLRDIVSRLGVLTWPDMMTVTNADTAFDDSGAFVDGKQQTRLEKLAAAMIQLANGRLAG
ncbi:NADPH-dependent FMN reductase [Permianibacter fluminis]|uniref:NADPH-dependent FMN reductase n=1 Tax=Permianibacter fluminis TaxID=2738515 RepID=UPI001B7D7826|nr:NAD(P)H-dependent oxidoreductase [Permianibacter fluminis]